MIGGNPQSVSKMLFTIGPDFSELSRLPKRISDGVRDCFQSNPIISRKDTRLRLDQIPNEKRGFWKGRREWGYGKQLESGYPQNTQAISKSVVPAYHVQVHLQAIHPPLPFF